MSEVSLELTATSERSGFLIGDLGQRLSRMRLVLREAISTCEDPEPEFSALAMSSKTSMEDLGPLLERNEIQLWNDLVPRMGRTWARIRSFRTGR